IAGTLTDEAIENGSIKKNPKKRGNEGESSKDRNERDDNQITRTGNVYATTLFDSSTYYSFVSTTFIPLLGIEPSDLGFSYEIKIASGQLVEIDKKQEEMVVVRDFPEVFLDDLSGLPPIREIKFQIELVSRAIPVAKSPYRLEPLKMEELSGQLKITPGQEFHSTKLFAMGSNSIIC
nr:putative reverse transcriptase domain-containing protein [Tanacetum cinerariifolium]